MEAGTAPANTPAAEDDGPGAAAIQRAASGAELTGAEERSALDWLLGATVAMEYDVTVQYDTPDGLKPLIFHFRQLDGARIDEIDAEHRRGDGPFAKLDVQAFNAALVAEATVFFTDPSGKRTDPRSEEFRGGVPSPALAVQARFKKQSGLLEGVAGAIREASAYGPDRIGTAQRALVEAGKP